MQALQEDPVPQGALKEGCRGWQRLLQGGLADTPGTGTFRKRSAYPCRIAGVYPGRAGRAAPCQGSGMKTIMVHFATGPMHEHAGGIFQ